MKKNILVLLLLLPGFTGTTQSIFWKVSGNGLKKPSYIFGTFHLLTSSYIDSLPIVLQKFGACQTFAGELMIDSTVAPKMTAASQLEHTTLSQLLPSATYSAASTWLKEISGYDLSVFNTMNPMTVSVVLAMLTQQKTFPKGTQNSEPGMDEYFQQMGRKKGLQVVGLETVEDQVNAIYRQFSNERQAELFAVVVNKRDQLASEMLRMNQYYRGQQLEQLQSLMYDSSFTQKEISVMLDERNKRWMQRLPRMMQEAPVFIAVGALHVAGREGLVKLLEGQGYTLTPIALVTN